MIIDKDTFFQIVEKFEYIPFEHTLAWENYKDESGSHFIHFVDDKSAPNICCWGRIIKKPLVGKILDIQGEIKQTAITNKQIQHFWKNVIEEASCNMITYNSVSEYSCNYEISMRRAGFIRPLGNRVCPLTIFIQTQEDRDTDRNWRRNLKKSLSENLVFKAIDQPTLENAQEISRMFGELKEMKGLGYDLVPNQLMQILKDDNFKLFYTLKDDIPLCARIVYIKNGMAADVFAANSFESRKYSATHFMMERIFDHLKEQGIKVFDFSRIPPSNNETDSVYVFKNSAGGYPVQYNGEWIWSKKRIYSLAFCVYNFFIRKAHQY